MTKLLTAHIGNYPRIGEHKDQQRHRRGMTYFLNKDISAHAFRDVEQSVIHEVVREQIALEMDEVTDGHIAWQDPISHFCSKLSGVKIAGLKQYFDTNFYYRKPIIVAKPKKKSPFVKEEVLYAQSVSNRPVRAVLTGPLTLACHTEGALKTFNKPLSRFQLFTDLLAHEIHLLVSAGVSLIQIDEPSLLFNPEYFSSVKKAFELFSQKAKPARLILAVYFSSALPLLKKLLTLPIDSLNVDLTVDGEKVFDKLILSRTKISIGLGLVNARTTRIEPINPLIQMTHQWLDKSEGEMCHLTPSSGLEYLPRDYASAKLTLLSKIKEEIRKR